MKKEFTTEDRASLLLFIHEKASLSPFIGIGYKYEDILDTIAEFGEAGLVENINGKLQVTSKGLEVLRKFNGSKKVGVSQWISPKIDQKISKVDENFIYLPNKSELEKID